jgi:hypothetical protein
MAPPLHPDVLPLAFLLGTWRGTGTGAYPTIESFTYREEVAFEHVGEPFLLYRQESWSAEGDEPFHFERGFVRPGDGGVVELCLAHPNGVTEISYGALDGEALHVDSGADGVVRTRTGSIANRLVRRYRVEGSSLSYELDMQTDATPLTRHLQATLERVG